MTCDEGNDVKKPELGSISTLHMKEKELLNVSIRIFKQEISTLLVSIYI